MESLKANANLFVNDNNNNIIIIIIIIKTIIDNGNLAMDIPRGGSSFYCFHQNLECLFLWRDDNRQEPTSTQPTCQIQLYYYLFQSQHETRDLLKNATHFWLTSTHPAPHTLSLLWFIMVDGIVSQSSAPRVISQQPLVFFCDSLQFRKFNQTDPLFCWQKTTVQQPALCMPPFKRFCLLMSSCEQAPNEK